MNALEPGQLWVLRLQIWAGVLAALILGVIAEVINRKIGLIPSGIVIGLVALAMIYPAIFVPGKHFRSWKWGIDAEELHIHHGVWTKVETIVPFRRVQHIDVSQNALQRGFHVTSLVIHTAGSLHSRVVVPGLSRETAEEIRDQARAVIVRDADDQ